jgi:glutathione S-transferase
MNLYYSPGACSLSPHIVLQESGLPFSTERVDLKTKQTETGSDFLQINPSGYVPALQLDDGAVLTEGPAIVQWIADQVPAKKLAPANGTLERARLQEWLNFISTELHKSHSPLFNPAAPEEWKTAMRDLLARRFATVAKKLEGRDYLLGADFTVADAYLFVVMSWGKWVKVDITPWPVLVEYQARVAQRPGVQAALNAEGLIK